LEPSEYLIVSIIGILKSGSAFVAIDNSYPMHRKRYIIENSNIDIFISTEEIISDNLDVLQNISFDNLIVLNSDEDVLVDTPISTSLTQSDLAYILYTSGSTGVPKE